MSTSPIRRRALFALKLGLGLAIVAWLVYQAQAHDDFDRLIDQPKRWGFLFAAWVYVALAVGLGFVRWYLLVQALGLPFSLRDAVRLGSLGFALNFVGPGGVGGDLFKAIALAREHRGRSSEAVATVIADRVVGLLSLLLIASFAILATGNLWDTTIAPAVRGLSWLTLGVLAVALVAGGLLMAPGKVAQATAEFLARLPLVGNVANSLLVACQSMSRRPGRVIPALALGLFIHFLLVLSFDTVARGLPMAHPTLADHLNIVPLAEFAGVMPLTPGGLGTTEAALAGLYKAVGARSDDGVIVALGQRLVMLTTGGVAIVYYLTQRRRLARELHAEALRAYQDIPSDAANPDGA